jgi:hypothetical protein
MSSNFADAQELFLRAKQLRDDAKQLASESRHSVENTRQLPQACTDPRSPCAPSSIENKEDLIDATDALDSISDRFLQLNALVKRDGDPVLQALLDLALLHVSLRMATTVGPMSQQAAYH